MRISEIHIYMLGTDLYPRWRPVVCRIFTDEGIYGDGEAAVAAIPGGPGTTGVLKDLGERIIGRNPLDTEVIWQDLYRGTYGPQNGGPIFFSALSAIDTALWDIKGKKFGVPVYVLLGGKKRDKLRCYASQIQFGWRKEQVLKTPEDYGKMAADAVSDGFDAIKVNLLQYDENGQRIDQERLKGILRKNTLHLYEERLRAIRNAVGEDVDILVENHAMTDAVSVLELAEIAEKYDVRFLEEPVGASVELTQYVSQRTRIPVATGERLQSFRQFAPYITDHAVSLLQPDIGNCGGITEAKKICDMADVYDIGIQCHVGGTPLATAAALQLECVIPNFDIHEFHEMYLQPYTRNFCKYDELPVNGYLTVSDRPGIGNEFSEDTLKQALETVIIR